MQRRAAPAVALRAFLVSHTHWDREWYRTFESFRARLVDTIDRVLELVAEDPGFRFLLDGQTIVIEDYLALRPERRKDLEDAVRAGRIAIGPWYVQPDSLLPSGEAHVRNLLEGRRVGSAFGPVSGVGYTPDSFGHPAQFPQLFAGFGLCAFVYWRGNPSELAELPPEYRWQSPDGSSVLACHLARGYANAGNLARDPAAAASKIAHQAQTLAERTRQGRVLLMNGFDHAAPCAETAAIALALAECTGWEIERGLLDDFVEGIGADLPVFCGELVGGCAGPLLPGVWSTRLPLKLRNRACEIALERLAEPFAALARLHGLADERPSLREAWRELLCNQAHDSIGGCSLDRVHAQMQPRYDACEELARETTLRALERLSGHGVARVTPAGDVLELAVWNPSPWPRAGVVRFPLDPWPALQTSAAGPFFHPWLLPPRPSAGFLADGVAARVVAASPDGRFLIAPGSEARDLELVVGEVPGFGWRRVRLEGGFEAAPDVVDAGREISCGDARVRAADNGTFEVRLGSRVWAGLCALEDEGDRGDSYDADPVIDCASTLESVSCERRRHSSGIEELCVERTLLVPVQLDAARERRAGVSARVRVAIRARVAPGEPGVVLRVRIENAAEDHRLRLVFPTGSPCAEFLAATTFDSARRSTVKSDAAGWIHPPPATFPQQGFVFANGLAVVAPGLPEAEVRADGAIVLTCLRAVGWLSRPDLRTRPGPAGPQIPVPGAQLLGVLEAELRLLAPDDPRFIAAAAREVEIPLQAVTIGGAPLAPEGVALLTLEPRTLVLSALKPAEHGDGIILRVQNSGDSAVRAIVRSGFKLAGAQPLRLDESAASFALEAALESVSFDVPPHALRSVRLVASGSR
jgi:alpha-mannosidase